MAGFKNSKERLNKTLEMIIAILIDNNINNWFISYGTLLGIVRDNSCIENDDDVDIIVDRKYFDKLHNILRNNSIKTTRAYGINNTDKIIKTIDTEMYSSIDFYCADFNENTNDFHDTWEKVIWTKCKDDNDNFVVKQWNNIELNLPLNYEKKLEGRYGKNWRIPQNNKGPMPRLKKL